MKPMLAATPEERYPLRLPCYGSFKLDGVRAPIQPEGLRSRKLKTFRNPYVMKRFSSPELVGLDGELIFGEPFGKGVFERTQSAITNGAGEPNVKLYVFDLWNSTLPYNRRYGKLMERDLGDNIILLDQVILRTHDQFLEFEEKAVFLGYEGIMTRSMDGPYKNGRSTPKEQWLMKFKRWADSEARVEEVFEEMENTNEQELNALGQNKRSHRKAGMVPKGRAGAIGGSDIHNGKKVKCAVPGDELKAWVWAHRNEINGDIFTYKFQELRTQDKPSIPIFKAFRKD